MRYLLLGALGFACLAGCNRQIALPIVMPAAPVAPRPTEAKIAPLALIHFPKRDEKPVALDTPFFSAEQRQAVEVMKINDVAEFGYTAELAVVEESEEERLIREQREALQAAHEASITPLEYPSDIAAGMEAVLRHFMQHRFDDSKQETIYLSIEGRKAQEPFLRRFADAPVPVKNSAGEKGYHIRTDLLRWKTIDANHAQLYQHESHGGSGCYLGYVLVRKADKWEVMRNEVVLWQCGGEVEVELSKGALPLTKPLKLLLPAIE